ncbi:SRSF protein kinase 3-like isoform X1 [Drosophila takahashii]|uniref:SRSF protein kinase 3-like isoform X1 n=1 Tax=Drosophila takahashii TaxID=29030 RepID=UPI001CF80F21|nr:SRSF protein kinase 3-like [Drosophila takahashii]
MTDNLDMELKKTDPDDVKKKKSESQVPFCYLAPLPRTGTSEDRSDGDLQVKPPDEPINEPINDPNDPNEPDELDDLTYSINVSMDSYRSSTNNSTPGDDEPDPVSVGDIFDHRYHAIKKLGYGHFSTVWLCFDCSSERYCAIKVVKSAEHFTETARDEIRLLCAVDEYHCHPLRRRIVEFIDHFYMTEPNGTHLCLVFEVLGDNLLTLIQRSRYHGLPLDNVKQIALQVLEGLYYLHHKCHIIHTDLKPENVIISASDATVRGLANRAISNYMKAQDKLRKNVHNSARGSVSQSENERDRCPDCVKLTKTAKRKKRARAKKVMTFFQCHRRWLRRQAIDDLLVLADRGQLTPLHAALGVTGQLGFMPFNFDGLVILNDSDVERLKSSMAERVGDVPADNLNSDPTISGDRPSRGRRRAETARDAERDEVASSDEEPGSSVDPLKLLLKSPEQFMRYVLRKVKESDRAAQASEDQYQGKRQRSARKKKKSGSVIPNPAKNEAYKKLRKEANLFNVIKDPAYENCEVNVKIADMGNGCWLHHHFTDDIQTREYRAVEVILGAGYNERADIWSAACLFWELATGDYLFVPKENRGKASLDEAHIASIIETCGPIPRQLVEAGEYSSDIFKSNGQLRHITHLKSRDLANTLINKYGWSRYEAKEFAGFLRPMLNTDPHRRISARDAIDDRWLCLCRGINCTCSCHCHCDCHCTCTCGQDEDENHTQNPNPNPSKNPEREGERMVASEEEPRPGTPDPRSTDQQNHINIVF